MTYLPRKLVIAFGCYWLVSGLAQLKLEHCLLAFYHFWVAQLLTKDNAKAER